MANIAQWVAGARPRTLPAAFAPVFAGAAVAAFYGVQNWLIVALCLAVALMLQIGTNYANDYSDGIRGTDDYRIGPVRLVGSGAVKPKPVKIAALVSFGLAAVAGLAVVILTQHWWLIALGLASIAAGWYYTGGKRPYGYVGLGELAVFIFFGLVAVGGTTYVLLGWVPIEGWLAAVVIGALACSLLVANNLRDVDTDIKAGKRTLATRLGEHRTRSFFLLLYSVAFSIIAYLGYRMTPNVLWAMTGAVPAVLAGIRVARGAIGRNLIPVLQWASMSELLVGIGMLLGVLL
ncbi:MAG: 1,4-dihydroxy-2-naphthoate polyprenyltransferase [Propionibacterium sp.]|nr:MAG: 1,4-dihydroxy-2-naphthoate polyprenyltransferase [Propionibacterium sp.]